MSQRFLSTLLSVVGIATLGLQASCEQQAKESSDLNYALRPTDELSISLLKEMSVRKTLIACVRLSDKTSNFDEDTFVRSLAPVVQTAVREWSDLIIRHEPSWPQKQRNDVTVVSGNKCNLNGVDFTINVWRHNVRFQADITAFYKTNNWTVQENGARSHAIIFNKSINYNHELAANDGGAYVLKHEFGHLLGLGDVYEEKNYQQGIGLEYHPPSVMKGDSASLTQDDALGLVAVWNFLKKGIQTCDASSKKKIADLSPTGVLFCIPAGKGQAPVITDNEGVGCPTGTFFSADGKCVPESQTQTEIECPKGMVLDSRSKFCVAQKKSGIDSCSSASSDNFSCMLQGSHCHFDDSKKRCVTKSGSILDKETAEMEKKCKPGDKYDVTRNKCVKQQTTAKKVIIPEVQPKEEASKEETSTEMQPKSEASATQETGGQCSQHTTFGACFSAWPGCKYSHSTKTCISKN